jgi:HEPN domain-containing protein
MIDEYIKKWLIKALNDVKVAVHEMALAEEEIVTDAVCFHCQQAVEKLLKAYLISKNVEFGRIHDLETLLKLCVSQDTDFTGLDVGNLTDYAVEIRYADEFYIPSIEEAKECLKIAISIKDFVLKKLGVSEEEIK